MLTGLFIENLAVIEKVYIDFNQGFTVFTGETGAGKSIVVDAINGILGGRCSKEIVRNGTDKAIIIASFRDVPKEVSAMVTEYGIEIEDAELIIQREVTITGKSSARVCGRPVTVTFLREIGEYLINIHGQHDNQVLLSPGQHIEILDHFAELEDTLEQYKKNFKRLNTIERELKTINENVSQKAQKSDMLNFQIDEIEQAELEPGEDSELENESRAIKNSTRILESLHQAYQALNGEDEMSGACDLLNQASLALEYTGEYYEDLQEAAERLRSVTYEAEEVQRYLSSRLGDYEFDQSRLDAVESRLDELFKLKRKYGSTVEEILEHLEKCKAELEQIELYDVRQNELMVEQKRLLRNSAELANELSQKRKDAANRFIESVSSELEFLNMRGVALAVSIEEVSFGINGKDKIEFLISTNVGMPPKPIAKIASGGELSRIMLAIKNALADKDKIPTLIFDEVDSGVSGSAAQKIGLKLKQVSKYRQILSVTHLAQIAALADNHYKIRKSVKEDRTFTEVILLDNEQRIKEVARIMSTGKITDLMLKNAEEMINNERN